MPKARTFAPRDDLAVGSRARHHDFFSQLAAIAKIVVTGFLAQTTRSSVAGFVLASYAFLLGRIESFGRPRPGGSLMKLKVHPLTPARWSALEDLFGARGACNGCWCMYWRIGAAYRGRNAANRAAFRKVVMQGPPPGLIAFDGPLAVGWCQLTPRTALPWLNRTWRLKSVDELPVWSISCLFVRIGHRNKGVTAALIKAAIKAAKRAKAPALEAYPLDAELTPSASGTGFSSTFARAGFKIVARHVPPRPIMRLMLGKSRSNQ